ncbi:MAG TPA: cytochrome c [Longimicrobiales bacterium]|nr:cytochrome c [Longimicrobiales bacterium]
MRYLKHPLGVAAVVMVVAYLLIDFGIAYIPPLLGLDSAPVPNSVVLQYLATVFGGVLLWVSANDERWSEFKRPFQETMVLPERRVLRGVLMVALPILIGLAVFLQVRPTVAAPATLRSIHPAPPSQIAFDGRSMVLSGLENPLRRSGSLVESYEEGKRVYYQNCLPCHGDALAGDGHYAHGFNPAPLAFDDVGTIAQLSENFVFWRVAKGGPGLPVEGTPWHSAMPVWEDFLTEEEIWSVIIFMYEQAGHHPRNLGEGEGEGGGH